MKNSNKFNPAWRRRARRFALQGLYQWQLTGSDITAIEAEFLNDNDLSKVDVIYFSELLREIPKCFPELDEAMEKYLDRKISKLDPIELAILRIAIYELSRRLDIPYRVAINEALELCKIFGATESHKYLNGVLDQVAKKLRAIEIKQ